MHKFFFIKTDVTFFIIVLQYTRPIDDSPIHVGATNLPSHYHPHHYPHTPQHQHHHHHHHYQHQSQQIQNSPLSPTKTNLIKSPTLDKNKNNASNIINSNSINFNNQTTTTALNNISPKNSTPTSQVLTPPHTTPGQ